MTKLTKTELQSVAKHIEKFEEQALDVGYEICAMRGFKDSDYLDDMLYSNDVIIVHVIDQYGDNIDSFSFPMSYLWNDDWKIKELEIIEDVKNQKLAEVKRLQKQRNDNMEEKDRTEYERLQKKYSDEAE